MFKLLLRQRLGSKKALRCLESTYIVHKMQKQQLQLENWLHHQNNTKTRGNKYGFCFKDRQRVNSLLIVGLACLIKQNLNIAARVSVK